MAVAAWTLNTSSSMTYVPTVTMAGRFTDVPTGITTTTHTTTTCDEILGPWPSAITWEVMGGYSNCHSGTGIWKIYQKTTESTTWPTCTFANYWTVPEPVPLAAQLRNVIHDRMAPNVVRKWKCLEVPRDIREQRARETLRRVIGNDKYRDFLTKGFVSVRGKTGMVYQIFPGHGITNVFDRGTKVERLCVVLQGDFPPTDSLIMRFLLILNNEAHFRALAVKHTVHAPTDFSHQATPHRTLAEIFAELKGGKHRLAA